MKNYYKIINISPDARLEEIKKSFRHLALKYHPDTSNLNFDTEAKFIEIMEAYKILSNEELRKNYDYEFNKVYNVSDIKTTIKDDYYKKKYAFNINLKKDIPFIKNILFIDNYCIKYKKNRILIKDIIGIKYGEMIVGFNSTFIFNMAVNLKGNISYKFDFLKIFMSEERAYKNYKTVIKAISYYVSSKIFSNFIDSINNHNEIKIGDFVFNLNGMKLSNRYIKWDDIQVEIDWYKKLTSKFESIYLINKTNPNEFYSIYTSTNWNAVLLPNLIKFYSNKH